MRLGWWISNKVIKSQIHVSYGEAPMQHLRAKYLLQPLLWGNPQCLSLGLKVAQGSPPSSHRRRLRHSKVRFQLRPLSDRCLRRSSWDALSRMDLHPESSWSLHGKTGSISHKEASTLERRSSPYCRRGFSQRLSKVFISVASVLFSKYHVRMNICFVHFGKWTRCFSWPVALYFMVNRCILLRHAGHTETLCIFSGGRVP